MACRLPGQPQPTAHTHRIAGTHPSSTTDHKGGSVTRSDVHAASSVVCGAAQVVHRAVLCWPGRKTLQA